MLLINIQACSSSSIITVVHELSHRAERFETWIFDIPVRLESYVKLVRPSQRCGNISTVVHHLVYFGPLFIIDIFSLLSDLSQLIKIVCQVSVSLWAAQQALWVESFGIVAVTPLFRTECLWRREFLNVLQIQFREMEVGTHLKLLWS